MITIRWTSVFILSIILILWFLGARDIVLAGIFLALFLVLCWTVREPRARRPVSNWFGRRSS